MCCRIYRFFLLLYGRMCYVMIDILGILLSNDVSCCELSHVCAYVSQVLARFFDDYFWFVGLLLG